MTAMKPRTSKRDRAMLASDFADMLERYGYDLGTGVGNVTDLDILPALPAFLDAVAAHAEANQS